MTLLRRSFVPANLPLLLALIVLAHAWLAASAPRAQEASPENRPATSSPTLLAQSLRALGLQTPPGARGDKAYRKASS